MKERIKKMQITKMNSQTPATSQSRNQSISNQQTRNSQPTFGIRFIIKPEAVDTFLKKAEAFSSVDSKDRKYYLGDLLLEEPAKFLQKLLREIIAHNKTPKKHKVYGNTMEITEFDVKYPRWAIDNKSTISLAMEEKYKKIESVSLLNSPDPGSIYEDFGGDIVFYYHVKLDDGSEMTFPPDIFLRESGKHNPEKYNMAETMQNNVIRWKNETPDKTQNDLNFLIAKTKVTGIMQNLKFN